MLMKTYLLDALNKFQRFSENLDVKTILCNKAWLIFNDSGDKEVYIFQEDGTLLVSVNGEVSNAAWQYVSANKSLIISSDGHSYMFRPSFMDDVIFALQQDGTNKFAFMIHEEQSKYFHPKSLAELNAYLEAKVQKQLEDQRQTNLANSKEKLKDVAYKKWAEDRESILKHDAKYQELKRKDSIMRVLLIVLVFLFLFSCLVVGNDALSVIFVCVSFVLFMIVLFVILPPISVKKDDYLNQKREEYVSQYMKDRL